VGFNAEVAEGTESGTRRRGGAEQDGRLKVAVAQTIERSEARRFPRPGEKSLLHCWHAENKTF
jgi:hypothetical protein